MRPITVSIRQLTVAPTGLAVIRLRKEQIPSFIFQHLKLTMMCSPESIIMYQATWADFFTALTAETHGQTES